MIGVRLLACLLAALLFIGCATDHGPLEVKQFTLRSIDMESREDPMVRQERLRRLYGAVSQEEQRAKLGQYFTVLWSVPEGTKDAEVLMNFQQGGSGSQIKTMRRSIEDGSTSGKMEFAVIGDDYFDKGRVLTWKIILKNSGQTLADRQSYLWE